MKRREFITFLCGAMTIVWQHASLAQQTKVTRIGVLVLGAPDSQQFLRALREGDWSSDRPEVKRVSSMRPLPSWLLSRSISSLPGKRSETSNQWLGPAIQLKMGQSRPAGNITATRAYSRYSTASDLYAVCKGGTG